MKIKPEHYDFLKSSIAGIDKTLLANHKQAVIRDGKYKDLEKRIMFDCLYESVQSKWICDNLYPYMDDTHIFSALKAINRELSIV